MGKELRSLIKYIIIGVLILSVSTNVLIFSYYLQQYSISTFYKIVINKLFAENEESYRAPIMPQIYTKDKLTLSFDKNVQTKSDFEVWKNKVLSNLNQGMNIPSYNEIQLKPVRQLGFEDTDNYQITKYSMDAVDDDQIIFYELLPKTVVDKIPAVIIIPGSGNQGALDVINKPSELSDYYYHRGIAKHIVREGYAVYVIENRGWGERAIDAGSLCKGVDINCSGKFFAQHLSSLGYNLGYLQVMDTTQLLKHIRNLEYIDSENIAITGLSLGGAITMLTSALNQEVKSVIMASSITDVYHSWTYDADGMLKYYDIPDIVSTIAPRPIYLSWGSQEPLPWFSFEAKTLYSVNKIKNAYFLFDAEENMTVVVHGDSYNSGHTFDIPSILDFLNKTIRK